MTTATSSTSVDPVAIALGGVLATEVVAASVPAPPITEALDRIDCPRWLRPWLTASKAAAAWALLAGRDDPRIRTVAGAGLVAYFLCAIGFHVKAKDSVPNTIPAVAFLAWAIAVVARTRRP